ncbi:MAG: YbhB/YbcL family Raf kinase inhibitor-like protein [Candidatus Falkowbacteria bacterium]|nr:YbhB/YbcL family Raf kinase inhibitor-like protein [Candidatus Falkowbacteria bacterium]
MKKIIIIIVFALLAVALIIFYLFSKNRQSFLVITNPDQLLEDQKTNNSSNINNMFSISSNFPDGGQIPDKYGCRGEDINPPLKFSGVPEGARGLALIIDDPGAPSGDWVHWLVFNIDPKAAGISENSVPAGVTIGLNSSGQAAYSGPCPPSGTHHYHFKLYALDIVLSLSNPAEKFNLLTAMKGHIIAQAELVGTYSH